MANLPSISRNDWQLAEHGNPGGMYRELEIIDASEIQQFPTTSGETATGNIEIRQGRKAARITAEKNSLVLSFDKVGQRGGELFAHQAELRVPTLEKKTLELVNGLIGRKLVLRFTDWQGRKVIVGSPTRPARLRRADGGSGSAFPDFKGQRFTMEAYNRKAPFYHEGEIIETPLFIGYPIQHLFSERAAAAGQELVSIDGTVYDSSGVNNRLPEPGRCIKLPSGALYLDISALIGVENLVCENGTPILSDGNTRINFQLDDATHGISVRNVNGTELAFLTCEEGAGTVMWNKLALNQTFNLIGDSGWGVDDSVSRSYANEEGGYFDAVTSLFVPMFDETTACNGSTDVLTGRVAYNGKVKNAPCLILELNEELVYRWSNYVDISLVEGVINDGTATLTLDKANRRVLCVAAGTCWNIRHLDGNGLVIGINPCSEGKGNILCDVTKQSNNSYDLSKIRYSTAVLPNRELSWTFQNEYFFSTKNGATQNFVAYQQVSGSGIDQAFSTIQFWGVDPTAQASISAGTMGGRQNVPIITFVDGSDFRYHFQLALSGTLLGITRLFDGFRCRISFDYFATGDIANLMAMIGQNHFVPNSLSSFTKDTWTSFSAESFVNGSPSFKASGTSHLIGFWMQSNIETPSQLGIDNFRIEILGNFPATLNSSGQPTGLNVLGLPIGKNRFNDLGLTLIRNPYRSPELNPHIPTEEEETWAEIIPNVADKQFSRTDGEAKSDLLTYPLPQSGQILQNINEYLTTDQE